MKLLLSDVLNEQYGKTVIKVTEQRGGWSARAFRIETNDGLFFLKAYDKHRASTKIWTAGIDTYMPIVIWLHKNTGLKDRIICPVLTKNHGDQGYKYEDDWFIYLLFPYIEGYTLCDDPMTEKQIYGVSEIIAELHRYGDEIPVSTSRIREDFSVPFCNELKEIIHTVIKPGYLCDPLSSDTIGILRKYECKLMQSIDKTETLSSKLKKLSEGTLRLVLCHTDVHGWNLMQSDKLILIDWEGMKLAPPEADLFAFAGNHFWHKFSDDFFYVYKKVHPDFQINPDALVFYIIRRRIEDIYDFTQELLHGDICDEDRKSALHHLSYECMEL